MSRRSSKLFISYSREDSDFTDQLDCGLRVAGYEPLIDRTSLLKGEDWKARLQAFIADADTVVFVLSPSFVASDICRWEIGTARQLGKRLMPVLYRGIDYDDAPDALARLNYVRFDEAPSFAHALKDLVDALEADIEWLHENTRLLTLAMGWEANERSESRLLRGADVDAAKALLTRRPASAPEPTQVQIDFVAASEAAELARQGREQKRLAEVEAAQNARAEALKRLARRTLHAMIAVGAIMVGLSVLAVFTWLQAREINRAELRLREGMALIVAETDHPVSSPEMWYRVATDFKLAIGILSIRDPDGSLKHTGTGFLMRGEHLSPDWAGQLVFATAGHVLTGPDRTFEEVADLPRNLVFPALDDDGPTPLGKVLFWSDADDDDFAVLALDGDPPEDASPIPWQDGPEEARIDGVAILHWDTDDGFALGLGHTLPTPASLPPDPRRMYYTHVTGPGASGSPVFSLKTGRLQCMHQAGRLGDGHDWGRCTLFTLLRDAIQKSVVVAPDG